MVPANAIMKFEILPDCISLNFQQTIKKKTLQKHI